MKDINEALEMLDHLDDYAFNVNSDILEAVNIIKNYYKERRSKKMNDIDMDKNIDKFLKEKEGKAVREFWFVERIKEVAMESTEGAYCALPERSTENSAGYDFFCPEETVCKSHEITLVRTGIKAKFPKDEALLLINRSSNPKKKGLILANGIGLVDSDYYNNKDNEGEIGFLFYNMRDENIIIRAGDKLGQGMFVNYGTVNNDEAKGKRVGGFGSTGV